MSTSIQNFLSIYDTASLSKPEHGNSIQVIFAKLQLTQSALCKGKAGIYLKNIEASQQRQKECADMIARARQYQTQCQSGNKSLVMSQEMKQFFDNNGITGCNKNPTLMEVDYKNEKFCRIGMGYEELSAAEKKTIFSKIEKATESKKNSIKDVYTSCRNKWNKLKKAFPQKDKQENIFNITVKTELIHFINSDFESYKNQIIQAMRNQNINETQINQKVALLTKDHDTFCGKIGQILQGSSSSTEKQTKLLKLAEEYYNKHYIEPASPGLNKDDWEFNVKSLLNYQQTLGTTTQTDMVLLQDIMSQYNTFLQGANKAIQDSNDTYKTILHS